MNLTWSDRPCPLCGSTKGEVYAEANIDPNQLNAFAFASRKLPEYMHARMIECSECSLVYASPSLSLETLETAYEEASFDSAQAAMYASQTYAAHIRRLLSTLPPGGTTLDIGTGEGAFVERLLELGLDAYGVEPSRAPVEAAKPAIRARIRQALFRAEDYPIESMSLITCFQTMEHVPHPLEVAKAAYALLKPGGAFVIVVHNRRAASAKIMGTKSPIFDIEHLQLFCPPTATALFEHAGFERIRAASFSNRYPIRYWLRLMPFPASFKGALLKWLDTSPVGSVPISVPAGNLIVHGFKPLGPMARAGGG